MRRWIQGPLTPEELDAVVRRFKKAIIERALGGELTHHLGYAVGSQTRGHDQSSQRHQREDGTDRRWSAGHSRCPPARADVSVVFFDALRVKIRDEAVVRSKAVYLALAVLPDGARLKPQASSPTPHAPRLKPQASSLKPHASSLTAARVRR
jgi:transposase-like protein